VSRAWFKFYGRDYRDGVRDLPWDVTGLYSVLLTLMYEEPGGRIKDHDQRLCRILGCDIRMWRRARQTLLDAGKLHVTEDGFLTNDRVEIEAKSAELLSEVRAISGRSSRQLTDSNTLKPRKTNKQPEAIAPDLPLYARALPESESETPSLRSGVPRKHKTPISPEAALSAEGRTYATEHGIVNGTADAVWAHFRDHHYANGNRFLDWDAAWRNWVRNQNRFGASAKPQRESTSAIIDRVFAEEEAKRDQTR
jgi:hypothetical protein